MLHHAPRTTTRVPADDTRRRFMTHFAGLGLGATLAPGVLWARLQDQGAELVTLEMVSDALKLAGIDATEEERRSMVAGANQALGRYEAIRQMDIPIDVSPPFHFSPLVPGIRVDKSKHVFRLSTPPAVRRPANLEDVAFWPVRQLAELLRTKKVTSLELTEMYLGRLHRYNGTLNNVVTFLDDIGRAQAKQADVEIAAGKYRGPLHGIPWGAKDIISVKGFPTTWGTASLKTRVLDYDASVVEMLRDAGAVLIAKLATGELASGDMWFGGQTKSPWDPAVGSSGSSAGPCSATAAGCVAFGIGTETSGSILTPSARCGVTGLRPTFGRVSRYGVMALSWTEDRVGPICRYSEDCAIVMQAIARPDDRDMSVSDAPFNWDAQGEVRKLRVGIIQESFDSLTNVDARHNAQQTLETLKTLGITTLVPIAVPDVDSGGTGFGIESAAYFDHMTRAGQLAGARGGTRKSAWLTPAVEYLQQQRVRMLAMMKLEQATRAVDMYLVGSNNTGGSPGPAGAGRGRTDTPADTGGRGRGAAPAPNPTQRHFTLANLACYPAINVPNGFASTGQPTNVVFYGRPFGEMDILSLAKAYQDAAGFHLKNPTRLDG
jgi:Asp-tRNA(Asn)/Glu-tRNA(Gln) amidotransferase A subunit family amidase